MKSIVSSIVGLGSAYLFIQIFIFATFVIPSDSMHPELKEGEYVFVAKPIYGARLFDVFATLRLEQVEIFRAPGSRRDKRNDLFIL